MSGKLETSKKSGPHSQLAKLAGDWEGIARVWFEPDKVQDESPVKGTMRLIMDGKYVLHEYKGSFAGKPLEGLAIHGYHLDLKRFETAWVDSFHTGSFILFSQGKREDDKMSVLGSYAYVTPEMEQYWGWRTEIEIINDDEIKITAYNVSPEGEEQRATEVIYNRVK